MKQYSRYSGERERIANNTAGFLETKAVEIACIQKSLSSMAGHRGEWTPFWWRRHIDSTAQRTMLTPKHSETGIISVYIHEQYVYRGRCAEGVVEMQMSCLSGRRSGYNFHGTQGRTYVSRSLHVRIYIIIERKERFPSSTDCFPSRPCYFIRSLFLANLYSSK